MMEPHVIESGASSTRVPQFSAAPRAKSSPDTVDRGGTSYVAHPNGGGLVATTARVDVTVFVGPHASVHDFAVVTNKVKLLDQAVVEGFASISGRCTLRNNARVSGHAKLAGAVHLVRSAQVGDYADISGCINIGYFAYIGEHCQIEGELRIE